jgi:hypothetical protein
MNLTAASSSSPATARRTSREPTAPRSESVQQHARDGFERALQARRQRQEAEDGEQSGRNDENPPAAWSLGVPIQPPVLRAAAAQAGPSPITGPVDPSGTRAAIEASLTACPGEMVNPLTGNDPAALWEVTLNVPHAVPLAVRAERTGTTEAQRAWGLTLASSSSNTDVLARHVPRLNERLRKHAIQLDHVRVEQADDEEL